MFKTPPSWSIPGKYEMPKNADTPSPCAYNPGKSETMQSPSWKIGKSCRNKQNSQIVPGPGDYNPKKQNKCTKFGKFNNQNYHKQNYTSNPSPANYSPNFKYNRPSSPQLSISAKPKQSKPANVPGPGAYQSKINLKKSQVSIKIGDAKRFQTQKIKGPGPQSYHPIANNFKRVGVAFTKENKKMSACSQTEQLQTPGPGSYGMKDIFQMSIQYKRGFSISSKNKPNLQNSIPGPGQYTPIYASLPQSPKVSMKGSHAFYKLLDTPGPSQYNVKQFKKNTCYGFSMGKSRRTSTDYRMSNPGPGSYNPKTVYLDTPKYSLYGSRIDQSKTISPGPGAYNADRNCIKKRPQSAKIGKSSRCQTQKQNVPGPGSYYYKPRPSTPITSFTRQERGKNSTQNSPGPGSYNIQPIIGQFQSYSSKQK